MYEHGIATIALTEALVHTNDLSLEPIIEDAIQMILKAQNTEHKPEFLGGPVTHDSKHYGGWRYSPDSVDSDLSVSGWPILALKVVSIAGFTVPEWSFQKALEFLGACHDERDGTFGYMAEGSGNSCVRGGIGALCLRLIGRENDQRIPPALWFMQNNPPVWNKEDLGNGYPFYYWYYGTRAMLNEGAEKQAATNVELILDASNSMWGQIQGVAKIAIAKDVLEQIINGLPDAMNVGLRLYGHRYGLNDGRACQDTELKVPIGLIDKAVLIDIIQNIQPKGKIPLVYSVIQAGDDFKDIPNGSIILITDGIESCDGDIDAITPALKESDPRREPIWMPGTPRNCFLPSNRL